MFTVCFLLMCLFSKPLAAQNSNIDFKNAKTYGSFVHFTEVPNSLFFFNDIKKHDTFEFRKALRNHDIDTIVLGSPGGSVFEGLSIAGVIFDRKLNTYIPDGNTCASACSFLFFAGKNRQADGGLGVHQFDTADADKSVNHGDALLASQFTTSEIIGFLNEFSTPPFVYEHMFATKSSDMYFFSKTEMKKINSKNIDEVTLSTMANLAKFVDRLKELQKLDNQTVKVKKKSEELKKQKQIDFEKKEREIQLKRIQAELNTLGCGKLKLDGGIGDKTLAAFKKFNTLNRSNYNLLNPNSAEAILSAMYSKKAGWCLQAETKAKEVEKAKGEDIWRGQEYCNAVDGSSPIKVKMKKMSSTHYRVLSFLTWREGTDSIYRYYESLRNKADVPVNLIKGNGRIYHWKGNNKDGYKDQWVLTEISENKVIIRTKTPNIFDKVINLMTLGAITCKFTLEKAQN